MIYLLDTDICIHLIRGKPSVVARTTSHAPNDLAISTITHYELLFGALRCAPVHRSKEIEKVDCLIRTVHSVPFANPTARLAAEIRTRLEAEGRGIGPMDVLIAACALENNLTLVTGNLSEFVRIPGLACETW